MLYSLEGFATLAGNLIQGVLSEEMFGVFPNEGVSCDKTVES